jgi:hypothetical protein
MTAEQQNKLKAKKLPLKVEAAVIEILHALEEVAPEKQSAIMHDPDKVLEKLENARHCLQAEGLDTLNL